MDDLFWVLIHTWGGNDNKFVCSLDSPQLIHSLNILTRKNKQDMSKVDQVSIYYKL